MLGKQNMKSLIIIFALFSSIVSFAYPKVGDFVKYKVSKDFSYDHIVTQEVIAIENSKALIRETSFYPDGTTKGFEGYIDANGYVSSTSGARIVSKCASYGGSVFNAIYKGKPMKVCRLKTDPSKPDFMQVGPVPFGVQKMHSVDKNDILWEYTLIDHKEGRE